MRPIVTGSFKASHVLVFPADGPCTTLSTDIHLEIVRYAMSDPEIIMSPLCREITVDGTKIQIDIYRGENEPGWILEVIDEENASTVWDEPFDTDQEALDAVLIVIEKDGIRSFLDGEYETMQ
jgi:uncharacterized protein